MKLADILFSQGFGSRRECAALIGSGAVQVGGQTMLDGTVQVPELGLVFHVNVQAWPYHARALVLLHDDPKLVSAAACEVTGEFKLRLTLIDGRYHQVKRMVAAAGNRVEGLHRSAFGPWQLPDDLAPGAWRLLSAPAVGTYAVPCTQAED